MSRGSSQPSDPANIDGVRNYLTNKKADLRGLAAIRDQLRAENAALAERWQNLERKGQYVGPIFQIESPLNDKCDGDVKGKKRLAAIMEQIEDRIGRLSEWKQHALGHLKTATCRLLSPENSHNSSNGFSEFSLDDSQMDNAMQSGNQDWNELIEKLISASVTAEKYISVEKYYPPMVFAILQARIAVQDSGNPNRIALAL